MNPAHTPANPKLRILITGSSGFVGKLLAEAEAQRGNLIQGIHHPDENPDLNFNSQGINLKDSGKLSELINTFRPQRVYHLAALSSVRMCQENPVLCFDTNLTGTLNLLNILSELAEKPRFLYTSSAEVYGKMNKVSTQLTENDRPSPANIYGLSKLKAEDICQFYCKEYQIPVLIARSFNHTGPGQAQRFVFPHVARSLVRIEAGKEPPVLKMGNLSVERDFMDVRDVIEAYMKMIDKATTGSIYNITSGRCISIEEGIRMMVEISGINVNIIQESSRMRPYDIPRLSGNAKKALKDLGWRAEITLEQTFKDLLYFWRVKEGVL